jgi:hypothetical protein
VVKRINNHVELTVSKADLEIDRFERWVRERVIEKIPGADRSPEEESRR